MPMLAKWLVIDADMASHPEHLEAQLIRWGGLYGSPLFFIYTSFPALSASHPPPAGLTSAPTGLTPNPSPRGEGSNM